jgi:hypothetical protein
VVCDRAILIVPTSSTPDPPPVRQTCTLAHDAWSPTWRVLEATERAVADGTIDVRHVRMTVDHGDGYWEHTTVDWYLAADGLPVEVISEKSSRSPSPVGAVVYKERYRIKLKSLVPLA